ncbi:glycoprotease family-domain-containing protein [Hypoxylon sp. NC1633]|nr:glycoprotease family-domain-containing protein [Hypoxylon sp. NC1633]
MFRAQAQHSFRRLAFRSLPSNNCCSDQLALTLPLSVPQPQPRRCLLSSSSPPRRPRRLLTLAIETSCDDTCVAILEKEAGVGGAASLHFNKKITSDNRQFRGVHPIHTVESHTQHLAVIVQEAVRALPEASEIEATKSRSDNNGEYRVAGGEDVVWVDGRARVKPDFVTVTRGPGMLSCLSTGLSTAKGLALAWDVPLLGVHHMQAHALTPRLVTALGKSDQQSREQQVQDGDLAAPGEAQAEAESPAFPFLSLLVSGGHTLLVLSRSLTDHAILAEAKTTAIGEILDKCGRDIVPASEIAAADNVMYGALLERFAFPNTPDLSYDYDYEPPATRADELQIYDSGHGWKLTPPLSETRSMIYDFAGFSGQVQKLLQQRPDMDVAERRLLARHTMRLAFEHLASRVVFALSRPDEYGTIHTLVVAGGVASNRYLMRVLRAVLDARGFGRVALVCPPLHLCTDNAPMIAWTGMEMYEAGWRSELDILSIKKWPLDPNVGSESPDAQGGGILEASGWRKAI